MATTWSPRAEIEAIRALADEHVRVESSDLLAIIWRDWLRVCLHIDHESYPTNRPLCFVEPERSGIPESVLEEAIAKAEAIPWKARENEPLRTFAQALVNGLCMLRDVRAPTIPPLAPSADPHAPNDLSTAAGDADADDDGGGLYDMDDADDPADDEDYEFAYDDPFDTSEPAAFTRGSSSPRGARRTHVGLGTSARASGGGTPDLPDDGGGCDEASGHRSLKKLKLGSGKIDEYSLYQRFGRAKPPPAVAESGTVGAAAPDSRTGKAPLTTALASTAQATDRLMKELKSVMLLDSEREGFTAEPVGDNLYEWEVVLRPTHVEPAPAAAPGAARVAERQPGAEKVVSSADGGAPAELPPVTLCFKFSADFPLTPPFVRVVRPRLKGNFVFPNGALCMELLTNDGWSPANSIESVIHQIRAMLIQGHVAVDSAATTRFGDTNESQARREFQQIIDTHKRSGWSDLNAWRS